MEIQRQIKIVI